MARPALDCGLELELVLRIPSGFALRVVVGDTERDLALVGQFLGRHGEKLTCCGCNLVAHCFLLLARDWFGVRGIASSFGFEGGLVARALSWPVAALYGLMWRSLGTAVFRRHG